MKIGKEVKVALFAGLMIMYIENLQKLAEFSKVARYKLNIYKVIVSLYASYK